MPSPTSTFGLSDFLHNILSVYINPAWQEDPKTYQKLRQLMNFVGLAQKANPNLYLTDDEELMLVTIEEDLKDSIFAHEKFEYREDPRD